MNLVEEERIVDHVVVDFGTLPANEIYAGLKDGSSNHGQIDAAALIAGLPQPHHDAPGYALYRIGDAAAGRNIHAAIYDALRLCKDF